MIWKDEGGRMKDERIGLGNIFITSRRRRVIWKDEGGMEYPTRNFQGTNKAKKTPKPEIEV